MDPRPKRLIIAQYTPPKDLSLVAAAELLGEGRRAMAAQIIALTVSRAISISRPPAVWRRSGFTLTAIRSASRATLDELDVLKAIFDAEDVHVGSTVVVRPRHNRALGERLRDPHRRIVARLIDRGLAQEKGLLTKLFRPWRKQPVVPTPAAEGIVDHLWGIHDYIRLAEQHRFAVLQSPDGAQRSSANVLLLNERLLPFAVLFGLEKEWSKQLDVQAREVRNELGTLDVSLDLVGASLDGLDAITQLSDLVPDPTELGDIVDIGDVLEGVGAVFGGIGEFLGGLSP